MKKKIVWALGCAFVLVLLFAVPRIGEAGTDGEAIVNKCHKICGKAYPKSFKLYSACKTGCLIALTPLQ